MSKKPEYDSAENESADPRHPAELDSDRLHGQCEVRFQRRSGPGGQHRNKVETCVNLTHRPTQITAQAAERRKQAENLRVALERLRIQLALQLRCEWRSPSALWQRRCQHGRLSVSRQHGDYPAILAEVLDVLGISDWQPSDAGQRLSCSGSQLVRLIQKEPAAFTYLNQQRTARGKGPLK